MQFERKSFLSNDLSRDPANIYSKWLAVGREDKTTRTCKLAKFACKSSKICEKALRLIREIQDLIYCMYSLYRKFETNIVRNETPRPHSQFLHSCICGQFLYISTIGPPILLYSVHGPIVGLFKSLTDT